MKRKMAFVSLLLILAGVPFINGFVNHSNGNHSLLMRNAEALAQYEGGGDSWQEGSKIGPKQIIVGYRTIMSPTGNFPIQVPVYDSIDCCIDSIRANMCNAGQADPRC